MSESEKIYENITLKDHNVTDFVAPDPQTILLYQHSDVLYALKSDGTSVSLETTGLTTDYYLKTQTYSTAQADANFLSANTSYYTQAQANLNFLSANTALNGLSDVVIAGVAEGDLIMYSGGTFKNIPVGTTGQVLTINAGGYPAWT